MIDLRDINKTYFGAQPLHVLKGISLHIDEGEFVSIMGASGSGKSTLLNILGILDNYDSGEYHLAGTLIKNLSERRAAEYRNHMIGFIFQSFNLIGFKTAVENVELPLFYQGVSRRKRHQMAMDYLDRLGLLDWADHYPNELSGGQKQRVAIARAHRCARLEDKRGGDAAAEATQRGAGHNHRRGNPRKRRGQRDKQDRAHQGRRDWKHRHQHRPQLIAVWHGWHHEVGSLRLMLIQQ